MICCLLGVGFGVVVLFGVVFLSGVVLEGLFFLGWFWSGF